MTHEYVIGLSGAVLARRSSGDRGRSGPADDRLPTALAWAGDRILAVGSDRDMRQISRGDSIFLDLDGCAVTTLPGDRAALDDVETRGADPDGLAEVLTAAGRLGPADALEPGSPADLAFWRPAAVEGPGAGTGHRWRVVAIVRAGAFTEGDEHRGPFGDAPGPASTSPGSIRGT